MAATTIAIPRRVALPRFAGLRDVSPANLSAGFAAILIYAFGPIPMYLATAGPLDPGGSTAVTGVFVAFLTAAIATIVLSLAYQQALAVGWSMPGLIYMTSVAPSHTLAQIVGACLVASVLVAVLTFTGTAERLMRAVPMPVVMGMLAGSTVAYCVQPIGYLGSDPLIAGAPVAGFFAARRLRRAWFPAPAGALLAGIPALAFAGHATGFSTALGVPPLAARHPSMDLATILPIALPLVLVTLVGNVQGLALLASQGYRTPFRAVTATTAAVSFLHAFFAVPPATMQRSALATVAGKDAGPPGQRYVAAIVAALGAGALAFTAVSAGDFTRAVPAAFISTIVGLTMLGVVLEAMKRSFEDVAPTAGLVAFLVASSDLNAGGIGPAAWAIVAGLAVYFWMERPALATRP